MRLMAAAVGLVLVTLTGIALAPIAAAEEKTASCTLQVTGMTCGGCAAAVKMAALNVDGVKDAKVSYKEKRAEITYDPAKTNPEAIAKAITKKSGFKASVPNKSGK